jgi:predicted DNA-binding protein
MKTIIDLTPENHEKLRYIKYKTGETYKQIINEALQQYSYSHSQSSSDS